MLDDRPAEAIQDLGSRELSAYESRIHANDAAFLFFKRAIQVACKDIQHGDIQFECHRYANTTRSHSGVNSKCDFHRAEPAVQSHRRHEPMAHDENAM